MLSSIKYDLMIAVPALIIASILEYLSLERTYKSSDTFLRSPPKRPAHCRSFSICYIRYIGVCGTTDPLNR